MKRKYSAHLVFGGLMALLLAAAGARAANLDDYLKDARNYYQKGEYRSAVIQLKNALQQNPDSAAARLLLARVYLRLGDGAAAEKEARRAAQAGGGPDDVRLVLGKAYILLGEFQRALDEVPVPENASAAAQAAAAALRGHARLGLQQWDEAAKAFQDALALNPDEKEAVLGQARLALARGDQAAAGKHVATALQRFGDAPEPWFLNAELQRRKRDFPGAAVSYGKVLEREPDNITAHLGRALMLLGLRDFKAAGADIEAVKKAMPDHPIAHYLTGLSAFFQNDRDAARDALQRVVQVAPSHGPSLLLLGTIYFQRGELEQAALALEKFVALTPDHLPGRKLYAAVLLKKGEPDRVIETLDVIRDRYPDDPQVLSLLGGAYLRKKEADKGIALLEKAVELAPDASVLRTQLALGYLSGGESDQAVSALQSAVDLNQGSVQADVLLVLAHLQRKEFDAALKAADQFAAKLPDSPIPLNMKGAAYLGKGDHAAARKAFSQALKVSPRFVTAHLNLARLDEAKGDWAAAEGHYRAALKQNNTHVGAMMALARLAARQGDRARAEKWLETAWEKNKGAVRPGVSLINLRLQQNEPLKALSLANELAGRHGDHPAVLEAQGRAQLANSKASSAVNTFRKLIKLVPKSPAAHYRLAQAEGAEGDLSAARRSLDRALGLNANYLPARMAMVDLKTRTGDIKGAVADARQIQKDYPRLDVGYKLEGDAHIREKDWEKALLAFSEAYEREPTAQSAMTIYRLHIEQKQRDKGVAILEDFLAREPGNVRISLELAMAYQDLHRAKQAVAAYKQALVYDPDNFVALNNLAWLYHEMGNARALELGRRAYELRPERPEVLDTYGWILVSQGNENRGVVLLQEAAMRAPSMPSIRYHLAAALDKAGRSDEAVKELNRLLREYSEFTERDDAEKLLGKLIGGR